jgi:hypothetical protein
MTEGCVRTLKLLAQFCISLAIFYCACSQAFAISRDSASRDEIVTEAKSGPVQLILRVSPAKPRLSDIVELEIDIKHEPDVEVIPPVFGQSVGEFMVRGYGEHTKDRNGKALDARQRIFRYQLEPAHSGKHLIRSIAVEFTDNRSNSEQRGELARVQSKPLEVMVTTEIGDAVPDLANLVPMQEPLPIQGTTPWVTIAAFVILITLFVGLLWATRKTPVKEQDPPKLSPEQIAQQELEKLLSRDLPAQGQVKEFFIRITGIVRTFIEGSTGIRAPEQTTEEFLRERRLENVFSATQTNQLKEFLEAADMIKYAGQDANHRQVDTAIDCARGFIAIRFPSSSLPDSVEKS